MGGYMDGKILYHYCSVETFFNIIANSTLWLSDVEKSNDYQECILCREYVNKFMEKYLEEDTEAIKAWKHWYNAGAETSYSTRTFAICFSESCDQLSQWRGYAQDGQGIAIGFDIAILEELNQISEHHIAFKKVLYDNIQEYSQEIIDDNIEKLAYKGVGHVALELNQNYRMKFPFVKNKCFCEEQEWRAVVCSQIGKYNIPGSNEINFSKIKYRAADGKLIPYIEMDFANVRKNFIKEIWIGPKSCVEIEDVENFLSFSGYYENVENGYNSKEPIKIVKSRATYR